jgi:hypothetical protein
MTQDEKALLRPRIYKTPDEWSKLHDYVLQNPSLRSAYLAECAHEMLQISCAVRGRISSANAAEFEQLKKLEVDVRYIELLVNRVAEITVLM